MSKSGEVGWQWSTPGGDANATERGVFGRLLQLGLQLMCLYFSGLGDGDGGKVVEIGGVACERGRIRRRRCWPFSGSCVQAFFVLSVRRSQKKGPEIAPCAVNLPEGQASYFVVDWLCRLGVKYPVYAAAVGFVKELF